MEIVLLRHGKVDYPPLKILSASEFKNWIHAYNTNEIDGGVLPPSHAVEMARSMNSVVCSDLPRSVESANILGLSTIDITSPRFREAGLPIGNWKYPKLSVRIWAIYFRVAWLVGYSQGSESFSEAKERAKLASKLLIELAVENEKVLFVGHGILNRIIAKELRSLGWMGPKVPARKYWEYGIYRKET